MKAPCCSGTFIKEQRPLQDHTGGTTRWHKGSDVSKIAQLPAQVTRTDLRFYDSYSGGEI